MHLLKKRWFGDQFDPRVVSLFVLAWALLFLPNLRTNPNWYSDEGDVLTVSWSVAHGRPESGTLRNDFLFPHPYPPLYLLLNGAAMRVCGNDIVVARLFQAVLALVCSLVLVWVGTRLRDRLFGWLCAAIFLVYPETVMNFRWVRPHPLAGTLALVAVGFLVRYLQEKKMRDVVWAGVFASLTTATHYYGYPLMGVVVATSLFVNRRHLVAATAGSALFPVLFVTWYAFSQAGGWTTMLQHAQLAGGLTAPEFWAARLARIYRNMVTFCFATPTLAADRSPVGVDLWLIIATVGVFVFPTARFRKWLGLWLLTLMFLIFRQQDNLPIFFYPACVFLPLLAVGCAGALYRLGDLTVHWKGAEVPSARYLPAMVMVAVFALISLNGAWGHFRTKVDPWTVRFPRQAEAAAAFVNDHTSEQDLVLASKNFNWLVRKARVASIPQALAYAGQASDVYPVPVPRHLFWTDADWRAARYAVLGSGVAAANQQSFGFDLVYSRGLQGVAEVVGQMVKERWRPVFHTGLSVAYVPVAAGASWPVAVDGEFIVLENPRFAKP